MYIGRWPQIPNLVTVLPHRTKNFVWLMADAFNSHFLCIVVGLL